MKTESSFQVSPRTRRANVGLTDAICRSASCPADKRRVRLYDQGGLYLEVSEKSKRWFYKFQRADNKRESRLAIGSYPSVSLKEARAKRAAARQVLEVGNNPVFVRKQKKEEAQAHHEQGVTFAEIAARWIETNQSNWSSSHLIRERRQIENDLNPVIGKLPIATITIPKLLVALKKIESRGSHDVAHRTLSTARQVFEHATNSGIAAAIIPRTVSKVLIPHRKKHFAAITDPEEFGKLLLAIDNYHASPIVRLALKIAPLVFQRPSELSNAEWSEFDFKTSMWSIPSNRMKRTIYGKETGQGHLVPISQQVLGLLLELQSYTGDGRFLFPGFRSNQRPISNNTMRTALLNLGYSIHVQSVHGFRASARTMMDEQLKIDPRFIELQLAHTVKDANGRAYNRTTFIDDRKLMMQEWADYLTNLKHEAQQQLLKTAA